jgi:hypothetical protein
MDDLVRIGDEDFAAAIFMKAYARFDRPHGGEGSMHDR